MDINSIVTVEEASKFYNNDPTGDQSIEFLMLWNGFSLIQVSEATSEEQLQVAFCASPPGSEAEKAAIQKMDEFAKKKR